MTRVPWLTDIHLNFVPQDEWESCWEAVRSSRPDALLVGGDIGESHTLIEYLERMDDAIERPIYFVLGNHDFYGGSIRQVRDRVEQLCRKRPRLVYLTLTDRPIELAQGVGLIGHDGWADGRVGDYQRSRIMLNDYRLIDELAQVSKRERLPLLHALGDEAAEHLRRLLELALETYEQIILLTHVPPLRGACWYEGQASNDEWAPHFTCQAVGDAILEALRDRPDRRLTVLCGHTHSPGEYQPLENVQIFTGGADYGTPQVQRVFEL